MKRGFKRLTALMACSTLAVVMMGCSSEKVQKDDKGRTMISDAERALDMAQVQGIFSKHAFYHQVGMFCEEMKDIWPDANGPNAATTKWTNNGNEWTPYSMIYANYCTAVTAAKKQELEQMSKIVPTVKNIPDNLGVGHEYIMHTQETPVIEIAGDGKTAKGLWYSIGMAARGSVDKTGKTSISTSYMWEKYACDFIKENGKWKMWHFVNIMDQNPVEAGKSSGPGGAGGPGGGAGGPGGAPSGAAGKGGPGGAPAGAAAGAAGKGGPGGAPAGAAAGAAGKGGAPSGGGQPGAGGAPGGGGGMQNARTIQIWKWSPTAVPQIYPKFPEPYYTFSETFSY